MDVDPLGLAPGCHSAPPLANWPTFSFFLASTEMTGSPVARTLPSRPAM